MGEAEERRDLAGMFRGAAPDTPAEQPVLNLRPKTKTKPGPKSEAAPPASATEAPDGPTVSEGADTAMAAPRKIGRPRTKPVDPDVVAPRGFFIPSGVKEWMKNYVRVKGITYTDLLVDAFNEVSDAELHNTFQPDRAPSGGMPRTPTSRRRRLHVDQGAQQSIRLSGAQEEWIEEKQLTVGAPSRSALVSAVLGLYKTKLETRK